jgi:hypothetical protein
MSGWPSARTFSIGVSRLAVFADVRDVQESGALEADFDERGLHAGQHARHPAHVHIADQPAAVAALDQELLHHARGDHRDAGFPRRDVDQYFFHQRRCAWRSSSSAVSYSGRPMTPE